MNESEYQASLALKNSSGNLRASLFGGGAHDGGELQLRDSTGANRLRLYGNAPGYLIDTPSAGGIDLFDLTGNRRIALRGGDGTIHLPQQNGNSGVFLAGQSLGGIGGSISLRDGDGDETIRLLGSAGPGQGSLLTMRNGLGDTTLMLNGEGGGRIDSASTINLMNAIGGNIWAQVQKNGSGGGAFRTLDELGNTTTFLASMATGSGGFLNVHMGNSTAINANQLS